MKFSLNPRRSSERTERAFTLVEIVLSLAIIAIAMIAIIGVIPIGLNVQTENQEESIISTDAGIWMEAFRNGAQGMEYLTNYINEVRVEEVVRVRAVNPALLCSDDAVDTKRTNYYPGTFFTSASNLLGMLSLPKYPQNYQALVPGARYTNWNVYAEVRALNGNLADTAADMDFAFKYRLTPELVPIQGLRGDHLTLSNAPLWIMATNLYDLGLSFQWPLIVGEGGNFRGQPRFPKSLNFRTLVSGQQLVRGTNNVVTGYRYFMAPRQYSYLTNVVTP